MKKVGFVATAAVVAPFSLALAIALTAAGAAAQPLPDRATSCVTPVAPGSILADGSALTSEQIGNASIIYQVSAGLRLPQQAAVIAIATAMQESSLANRPGGDLDSIGLFQQRPSQGWGSPSQLVDPVYASNAFYAALVKVPNWQTLPVTEAAQSVQKSLYPDAYAKWESLARQLVATVGGTATNCSGATGDGDSQVITNPVSLPASFSLPPGTPTQVVTAIQFGISKVGMPYQWGGVGNPSYDCSGLLMKAYEAAGITIHRTTYEQVLDGTPVYSATQLKPGDLIFTAGSDGTASSPGHVGMYLGSDLVLDAPRTGKDIQITHFSGGYWDAQAVAFRRIA